MAIAAVAHAYVFTVEPYQHVPAVPPDHGEVICQESKMEVEVDVVDDDTGGTPATMAQQETHVEAPGGTSIKESVQDVVLGGGQHVCKPMHGFDIYIYIARIQNPSFFFFFFRLSRMSRLRSHKRSGPWRRASGRSRRNSTTSR